MPSMRNTKVHKESKAKPNYTVCGLRFRNQSGMVKFPMTDNLENVNCNNCVLRSHDDETKAALEQEGKPLSYPRHRF